MPKQGREIVRALLSHLARDEVFILALVRETLGS